MTESQATSEENEFPPQPSLLALTLQPGNVEVCVLYPPGVVAPQQTRSWIRAHGESFVSVTDWR